MFDNLVLLAVIVLALWLGSLGLYLYASRQQQDIEKELKSLRNFFEEKKK